MAGPIVSSQGAIWQGANGPPFLPRVNDFFAGPYNTKVSTSHFADRTVTTLEPVTTFAELSPFRYKKFIVNSGSQLLAGEGYSSAAIFIRCAEFQLAGTISVNGEAGHAGDQSQGFFGGAGGNGPSGGGGGSQSASPGHIPGGQGADQENGLVPSAGGGDAPGAAGLNYTPAYTYVWPTGGGTSSTGTAPIGAGRGGNGGWVPEGPGSCLGNQTASGGGGGGAGMIVICTNLFSVATGTLICLGGAGGAAGNLGLPGQGGGDGPIIVCAVSKTTATSPSLGGSSYDIYKIESNGSLTAKNWTDTW